MASRCLGRLVGSAASLALLATGCGSTDDDGDFDAHGFGVAHPGPWQIPADTLAIGDTQSVSYTGAGPWPGNCSGGITSGAQIVADYLEAHFAQMTSIGGYSCRAINGDSTKMSVHGTGRALDVFIPLDSGEADNDLGDPVGNWLIENAEAIGIQYIIWDLWTWNASRSPGGKDKSYGGAHPHHDHLHIEVSEAVSTNDTPWFDDAVTPPALENCEAIGPLGGIIDEKDGCFQAFGPAMFWRVADGVGYEDSLLWTNAFENDAPSNWARWNLDFEAGGEFTVDVYVSSAFAVYGDVRYEVRHDGSDTVIFVDQSGVNGWTSLGDFSFVQGAAQHVAVFDDVPTPIPNDQSFVVDAIRLTPASGGSSGAGGTGSGGGSGAGGSVGQWPGAGAGGTGFGAAGSGSGATSGGPPNRTRIEETDSGCACRAATSPPRPGAWWMLLALVGSALRRRARITRVVSPLSRPSPRARRA